MPRKTIWSLKYDVTFDYIMLGKQSYELPDENKKHQACQLIYDRTGKQIGCPLYTGHTYFFKYRTFLPKKSSFLDFVSCKQIFDLFWKIGVINSIFVPDLEWILRCHLGLKRWRQSRSCMLQSFTQTGMRTQVDEVKWRKRHVAKFRHIEIFFLWIWSKKFLFLCQFSKKFSIKNWKKNVIYFLINL